MPVGSPLRQRGGGDAAARPTPPPMQRPPPPPPAGPAAMAPLLVPVAPSMSSRDRAPKCHCRTRSKGSGGGGVGGGGSPCLGGRQGASQASRARGGGAEGTPPLRDAGVEGCPVRCRPPPRGRCTEVGTKGSSGTLPSAPFAVRRRGTPTEMDWGPVHPSSETGGSVARVLTDVTRVD